MTFSEFVEQEPQETRQALRKLFHKLPDETPVKALHLEFGECCMRQGDTSWNVCTLVSGKVDVFTHQADYSIYALRDFTPFALFGHYEALADYEMIVADVRARTDCRFLVLSKTVYLQWVQSDVSILMEQMRSSICTLLLQGNRDRNNLTLTGDARLAIFLVHYYREHSRARETSITVWMTHNQIAEATGLSLRTVNRLIAGFRTKGLLGTRKGKITLTPAQAEALQKLSVP